MDSNQLFTLLKTALMVVVVWIIPLSFVPFFIWLERKGSAIIQDRIGPNRTNILGFRLLGYIQNFADTLKLIMKENIIPTNVDRFYFLMAPFWSMTVSLLPLLVIPLAAPLSLGAHTLRFQACDLGVGILFVLSITSMGVYGIILAGWSSNNKYSLIGAVRSSAQMISYELSMGLSLVGLLMVYQNVQLSSIVETQGEILKFEGMAMPLPNWGIFLQPLGFLIFLVAAFAETNRNPFDLAEGDSELVAGFHVEYSSVKFALFFMAEYVNMAVVSFILATLFLGGYQVPYFSTQALKADPQITLLILGLLLLVGGGLFGYFVYLRADSQKDIEKGIKRFEPFLLSFLGLGVAALGLLGAVYSLFVTVPQDLGLILVPVLQLSMLLIKVLFFCWLFVWVRWTLPRFRYDQLMKLGWKLMLPLALGNLLVTGLLLLAGK
jgi:NADH-quinone oxidoreductase subunit H